MFPDAPSPVPQSISWDDGKDGARIGFPTNSRPCESCFSIPCAWCLTGFFLGLAAGICTYAVVSAVQSNGRQRNRLCRLAWDRGAR